MQDLLPTLFTNNQSFYAPETALSRYSIWGENYPLFPEKLTNREIFYRPRVRSRVIPTPPELRDFSQHFSVMDRLIMEVLGDNITFYPPDACEVNTKCILSARPGSGNKPGFEETDNIWAKIDIYSTPIELLENSVPGLSKTWIAFYQDAEYAISEILYKGDNTLTVILYHPGSTQATLGGWK